MKRKHDMPFGAQVVDETRTRFRLWAPSAEQVHLCAAVAEGPPGRGPLSRDEQDRARYGMAARRRQQADVVYTNLGDEAVLLDSPPPGALLYIVAQEWSAGLAGGKLPAWTTDGYHIES